MPIGMETNLGSILISRLSGGTITQQVGPKSSSCHVMKLLAFCLIALSSVAAAYDDYKDLTFHMVRLRPGHRKLKLSYKWVSQGSKGPYEICYDCKIVDHERPDVNDGGFIIEGDTCGGPGNGCHTLKGEELHARKDRKISIAMRYRVDATGEWSKWTDNHIYDLAPHGAAEDTVRLTRHEEL